MNIYVSYRYAQREGAVVTAWIEREYFRNAAGIDKNIVELMRFDCTRAPTRLALEVCGQMNALAAQTAHAN